MFIRAYLRASTEEQDANRAKQELDDFAWRYGKLVASRYSENASGATKDRPELRRLLDDSSQGDIVLVESVDRLTRLNATDWKTLRGEIAAKGLRIVAVDLPTTWQAMSAPDDSDDFTGRMLDAINSMMLDVVAAVARKDYEQRRERQAQGIAKAQARGVYRGKPRDLEKRRKIVEILEAGFSIRRTAALVPASTATVQAVKKELEGGAG